MKRVLILFFALAFLMACAGNPPAWWNPNNRYGTTEDTSKVSSPAKPATQPRRSAVVKEESMDPLPDNSYEEITLTPMPDEDNENETGLSASQNEELLADDTLPLPSVLD